jgi:hypothetical protein
MFLWIFIRQILLPAIYRCAHFPLATVAFLCAAVTFDYHWLILGIVAEFYERNAYSLAGLNYECGELGRFRAQYVHADASTPVDPVNVPEALVTRLAGAKKRAELHRIYLRQLRLGVKKVRPDGPPVPDIYWFEPNSAERGSSTLFKSFHNYFGPSLIILPKQCLETAATSPSVSSLFPVLHEIGHDGFSAHTLYFRFGRPIVLLEATAGLLINGLPIICAIAVLPIFVILGMQVYTASRIQSEFFADMFAMSELARDYSSAEILHELDRKFQRISQYQTGPVTARNPSRPIELAMRLTNIANLRAYVEKTGRPIPFFPFVAPDFVMYVQTAIVGLLVYFHPGFSWSFVWTALAIAATSMIINLFLVSQQFNEFLAVYDAIHSRMSSRTPPSERATGPAAAADSEIGSHSPPD